MGQSEQKWRIFTATFLLTASFLALIMTGAVMVVQPAMPGARQVQEQTYEYVYRPQAQDTLTLLVIGVDNQNVPGDFLLLRFNPQYGQVPLTLLPAQTAVTMDGRGITLEQAYRSGGGVQAADALSRRLGIVIDRYAALSRDMFLTIANKVGTVVYTLPYDVSYNRSGFAVNLAAGKRRLDAQDVADLFGFPDFKDGAIGKSEFLGGLVEAVINQNLKSASEDVSPGLFRLAVNLVRTNVTFTDYELRRDAADFVSKLDTQVAGHLTVSGNELESGAFELSEDYVRLVRQYFQTIA